MRVPWATLSLRKPPKECALTFTQLLNRSTAQSCLMVARFLGDAGEFEEAEAILGKVRSW